MTTRKEKDTMGEIDVPSERYWGAQTQRSLENFPIGKEKVPFPVVLALVQVKKAAAFVNAELGVLDEERKSLIVKAADWILNSHPTEEFPLVVWQTGSGTQSNMNVNEVIANYANELAGGKKGEKSPIHPNDHVNKSQSSNDVFPTATHIAAVLEIEKRLLPALQFLLASLQAKEREFQGIIKIGRTHLMDATPMTLGQEFSAFREQIEDAIQGIEAALPKMREIALGGTAVGTGLNTPLHYAERMAQQISLLTGSRFISAPNKFQALSTIDAQIAMSGALRSLAVVMMKMANDIRLLGSGPRCGIGELLLPENEPGSSIMPGKVNPTQSESLTQIAAQVMGNDLSISISGASGQLQLNVFRPMVIYNLLQSIHLLTDGAESFVKRCLHGLRPNRPKIQQHLDHSLMLVTALAPHIGYDSAAKIAKYAHEKHLTLKQAALELGLVSNVDFDRFVDPSKMLGR